MTSALVSLSSSLAVAASTPIAAAALDTMFAFVSILAPRSVSSAAVSPRPSRAAMSNAVIPPMFFAARSAPLSSNTRTIAVRPAEAASISGVMPPAIVVFGLAPLSRSRRTMASWPPAVAPMIGVMPTEAGSAFLSAPLARSSFTLSALPVVDARTSSSPSWAPVAGRTGSTVLAFSSATTSVWPSRRAISAADLPNTFFADLSAPFSSRRRTISTLPLSAAIISGVRPSGPG